MARPVTIRDEDILAAAREIFLERGITATTAEIAARAGVSEGSIFKRFKTKIELFHTAMATGGTRGTWSDTLALRIGKGDMQSALVDIALEALDFVRKLVPLVMMSWSNAAEGGLPPGVEGAHSPAFQTRRSLAAYFEAEMKLQRLRRVDPEVMATVFLGTLWNYASFELFMASQGERPIPPERFIRDTVQFLWAGADPHPTTTST